MTELGEDGKLCNSSVLFGPDGVIGSYRKICLWNASLEGNEHLGYQPGKELYVFDSPLGKVGLMICADMYRLLGPELKEKGADLLVAVSAWPTGRGAYYSSSIEANAQQARRWLVVSNQVGHVGHFSPYGHSRIVDPNGNVIADTGDEEGMVVAQTSLKVQSSAFERSRTATE